MTMNDSEPPKATSAGDLPGDTTMDKNGFLQSFLWPGFTWFTHAFVGLLLFMVLVRVVPQFVVVWEDFETELPAATQMLIRLSSLLINRWYLILLFLAIVDAAILFGLSQVPPKLRWLRSLCFNATMLAAILFLFFSVVALALPISAIGRPTLKLAGTTDTDALLVHVRGLTNLQGGDRAYLDDDTLGLTNLRGLDLTDSEVTDAGLEHLKELSGLSSLYLSGTQISDAGLEHLSELSSLEVLFLVDTQITDAGLEHLRGLTNLRELPLYGTQVTDEGAKNLQEALPDCFISH
jgi:hypothetical protein